MDDGGIEAFMQFGSRVAKPWKHIGRKLHGRAAARYRIPQRLSLHILHNHDVVFARRIAVDDARNKTETASVSLRFANTYIRRPHPRVALDVLAYVRTPFGPVLAYEHHALGGFARTFLQHRIDAISRIALQGVEIFFQFIGFHKGYATKKETGDSVPVFPSPPKLSHIRRIWRYAST